MIVLFNLKNILKRCIENDLMLNWKKCHFKTTSRDVLDLIIMFQMCMLNIENDNRGFHK